MLLHIHVIRGKTRTEVEIDSEAMISDLLEQIGVNRETVLIRLNQDLAVEEERLEDGDVVEIITAISGG